METLIEHGFRFVVYAMTGMAMETVFAVEGIERLMGATLKRRVPKKYLEGFVSLYMIPLHGLGMLYLFEWGRGLTGDWAWPLRYLWWAVMLTFAEVAWGFLLDKVFGFYSWDYYAESRFRIFRRGYSMWTLVPMWGVAGLVLERWSDLLVHLSPFVSAYFLGH